MMSWIINSFALYINFNLIKMCLCSQINVVVHLWCVSSSFIYSFIPKTSLFTLTSTCCRTTFASWEETGYETRYNAATSPPSGSWRYCSSLGALCRALTWSCAPCCWRWGRQYEPQSHRRAAVTRARGWWQRGERPGPSSAATPARTTRWPPGAAPPGEVLWVQSEEVTNGQMLLYYIFQVSVLCWNNFLFKNIVFV